MPHKPARLNRSLKISKFELEKFGKRLVRLDQKAELEQILNKTINQNLFDVIQFLPQRSIDLIFVDPPYNIYKKFNLTTFKEVDAGKYEEWLELWVKRIALLLKHSGSLYLCGDWRSAGAIYNVLRKYFVIRNRITWEREKGRGAKSNWKNSSEDIWFCTVSNNYTFNVHDVKLKRRVLAPYRLRNGLPKDWGEDETGKFRVTHPSNLWSDISVPFWSMPENTDHPTQKPEKLLAKIILASSNVGDVVLDPFLGSGTTSVVSKKLGRKYIGIEVDEKYCCIAEKRLELAKTDKRIQGYVDGVFWERNTLALQKKNK